MKSVLSTNHSTNWVSFAQSRISIESANRTNTSITSVDISMRGGPTTEEFQFKFTSTTKPQNVTSYTSNEENGITLYNATCIIGHANLTKDMASIKYICDHIGDPNLIVVSSGHVHKDREKMVLCDKNEEKKHIEICQDTEFVLMMYNILDIPKK
jgi:hypothetical protein